ncbi:hypothetical protein FQR65_LT06153 [Abscondita terminalis]|nr:hypothetical protein FQR65_LT06153 [Abscondita terminalis]
MMWFLLTLTAIPLIVYFYLIKNHNYWKIRNVAYAKPVFFFGNILDIIKRKKHTSEMLKTLYESTTAPYLGFFMFDQPYLLIRDLDLIKNILITDFDNFSDRPAVTSKNDPVGSKLLFLLKGKAWKDLRKSSNSLFTISKIKRLIPLINKIGDDLVEHIEKNLDQDVVDGRLVTLNFGIDMISSCVFGIEVDALKGSESIFGCTNCVVFLFSKVVNLLNATFLDKTASNTLSNIFNRVCEERSVSGIKRSDFVDFLNIATMNGDKLDDEYKAGFAIQMLLAGYETTGTTTSFLLYELCHHIDVQKRLRIEVENVLKNNNNNITYEAINQMTYMGMVINEIVRKYPVLGFLDRLPLNDYRVPGTNFTIEKGIPVVIPVFALHRDGRYFPEPEKFDPERFSQANKFSIPTYAYMPFGEGLRYCIGNQLALLTIKIFMIKILSNFNIVCCKDTPKCMKFDPSAILLCPQNGELKIKFTKIS